MKFMLNFLLLSTAFVSCDQVDTISTTPEDIEWYTMPYDMPRETNVFGGKSWRNLELDDSKREVIWPYSVILDTDKIYPPIMLFCHKGRCCLWFDTNAPWVKKSCLMYSSTKDESWLRLEYRAIANNRGQTVGWADIEEISESEFCARAHEYIPGTRFIELRGPQVVIGSCGCLRGYILKDISPNDISCPELKRYLQFDRGLTPLVE